MALQAGTRLGPYEILAPLGAGGMGEVYRARDRKLGRDVAIKILPESFASDSRRLARFDREAQTLAALNHPGIAAIYGIGESDGVRFLVLELVSGETMARRLVRGQLAVHEALGLCAQIAEALAAAHEKGVVHRDLKPSNVHLTPDGKAKLLDFGLAKLTRPEPPAGPSDDTASDDPATRPGTVVGTVGYMSPEQARGEAVDHRSDIFSFGAVAYEMLTGERAFPGRTPADTMAAILREDPPQLSAARPDLPPALSRMVARCLEKRQGERFQSAHDLALALHAISPGAEPSALRGRPGAAVRNALRAAAALAALLVAVLAYQQVVGPPDETIRSIAVLPLENLSGDPEQEYFADGMTEALIAELAQVGALKVISRTSVMQYKGAERNKSLPEIASELGVDAVIEGSAMRVADRLRITAQLIHAETDEHLWARSYDRQMRDILALQSEVARAIVGEIRVAVTTEEEARLARARPVNPDAYEAYLLGRHRRDETTPANLRLAIEHFERAISLEPGFALPYTYLVHALIRAPGYSLIPQREVMERARAAALKAVEIDPHLAEAHAALGQILSTFDFDWSAAERAFREAIALNSGSAETRHLFAVTLSRMGRHREAISEIEQALELDPLNLHRKSAYGLILYLARRYDDAIRQLQIVISVNPSFHPAHRYLGCSYLEKEMYDDAIAELQQAVALAERNALDLSFLGFAHVAGGEATRAKEILQELEERAKTEQSIDTMAMFHIHWLRGDEEEALNWLERAIEEREAMVTWLPVTPLYDPLRSDPRFQDLMRRLNLPS